MDNVFFNFVRTYWEEINAFYEALLDFIEALINKATDKGAEEE